MHNTDSITMTWHLPADTTQQFIESIVEANLLGFMSSSLHIHEWTDFVLVVFSRWSRSVASSGSTTDESQC